MTRTGLMLLAVALLLLSLQCSVLADEASYEGKTVSQWLADLSNSDAPVRSKAAVALGKMGDTAVDAIGKLADRLADKDENVRANAAWALGAIGWDDDAAVNALIRTLGDAIPAVRGRAVVALGKIGVDSPEAVARIKSMAENDKDERVRRSARDAVAALAPSDQEKSEYKTPEPEAESETPTLDSMELLTAIPDRLTEHLGPLRRHNEKLTVIGLKVVSIDEDPKPATKEQARKWAEDTRAVGREMVAECRAFANTLHSFVNAKTRKGLAEEVELVRANTELMYEVIGQYQSVASVDRQALKRKIVKETIVKEAKAYALSRLKKRIAERLDDEGLREVLNAKSWNEAFDKTLAIARKNTELEIDKATQKAFGLPFHDEASLKVALKQRFHEVAERQVAKIIVRLASNGIIIKLGAHEAIKWLEKNWWPHVREALREKGKFDIRVPESRKTLDAARRALYNLPDNAKMTDVRKALDFAKGKLAATRYLEKDLRNARRPDLLRKLNEAQDGIEQVMDITAQRFMLAHREAVEKLGNVEEELGTLIWLAQMLVDSVKEPPVKEEEKKPEQPEVKPAPEPSHPKQEPPKPSAKFEGLSFTAGLDMRWLDRNETFEGTVTVNLTANGTFSGSYSATRTRDLSAYKIPTPGKWRYSGTFQGRFDAAAVANSSQTATANHKMTVSWEQQYWYPNRDNGVLKTDKGSKEYDATVEISIPYAYKPPFGGSIATTTDYMYFKYAPPAGK